MNRLPKEKRDKLILVCIVFAAVLLAIGLLMIHPEYDSVNSTKTETEDKRHTLETMQTAINKAAVTDAQLKDTSELLGQAEKDMAIGDPNAWIYDTIRGFKSQYKMDINIASGVSIGDADIMAKFPYKQLKVTINGSAYYHDLGKFIADFENNYPHGRICNLMIHPSGNGEKLNFSMDIIALIKPTQS